MKSYKATLALCLFLAVIAGGIIKQFVPVSFLGTGLSAAVGAVIAFVLLGLHNRRQP